MILTTIGWLATAYLGPRTDAATLIEFYKKIRPFGPGWAPIRVMAGISKAEAAADLRGANVSLALAGWSAGVAMIWSALFMVGNFLYGRMGYAAALAGTKTQLWPGIDIDIPTAAGSAKSTPEGTRDAVLAAFRAGSDGVILSRKYSEMRLANLAAAGRAVREAARS